MGGKGKKQEDDRVAGAILHERTLLLFPLFPHSFPFSFPFLTLSQTNAYHLFKAPKIASAMAFMPLSPGWAATPAWA